MSFAAMMLKAALNQQMASLEKALRENGAEAWKAYIVTYHPEIEGAWIVVEGRGATAAKAKAVLRLAEPDPSTDTPHPNPEVEKDWQEFWLGSTFREGYTLNDLKAELADYHTFMGEVGKVYCEITHDRISKPNTKAEAVIGEYQDVLDKVVEEETAELRTQLERVRAVVGAYKSAHDLRWAIPTAKSQERLDAARDKVFDLFDLLPIQLDEQGREGEPSEA